MFFSELGKISISMKGSLQEQLLKAGLVNKERTTQSKKKNSKKKRKPATIPYQRAVPDNSPSPSELKKQKELRVEVKKRLRSYKVNDKTGEIAYNYTINNRIKRFFVTEEQQKQLIEGALAIANWNGISYLIPIIAVEELRSLYPKINICVSATDKKEADENDPYAEYAIPDDLKW